MTPPRRRTHNSTHGVSETRRPEPAPARALSTRAALPDAPATRPRRTPAQRDPHTLPTQRPRGAVGVPRSVHTATLWAALRHTRNPFTRRGLAARALARASRPLPRRLRLRQDTAVTGSPPLTRPRLLARRRLGSPPRCPPEVPRHAHGPPPQAVRARGACKEGDTHVPFDPHTHTECSPREERNADSTSQLLNATARPTSRAVLCCGSPDAPRAHTRGARAARRPSGGARPAHHGARPTRPVSRRKPG